ncbi:MAG TPA: MerR family transcriptional regulator, partial [Candidatus Baltobacteraceae bacterium]|nr:MerR family transcriptional regulator [Candidatus Baltobacteraceae bacterium]
LLRAKEFASKAGVTVRTLHFYDRLGVLSPVARTESGYRLYGDAELERLEQILALRFVGFGLGQIKTLLQGPPQPLLVALRLQRLIIAQEKRRLELALDAIDEAESLLGRGGDENRWAAIQHVIEAFKMKNDWSWTEKYYAPEDPAGARAQALAKRWCELVRQFTQGDPGITKGLNRLYSDQTHWPKDFKRPWSDAAEAFLEKARESAKDS